VVGWPQLAAGLGASDFANVGPLESRLNGATKSRSQSLRRPMTNKDRGKYRESKSRRGIKDFP